MEVLHGSKSVKNVFIDDEIFVKYILLKRAKEIFTMHVTN